MKMNITQKFIRKARGIAKGVTVGGIIIILSKENVAIQHQMK